MKKIYILLAIGLVIFLIIQFPHATISPGELVEAHRKLNNECLSCHKPFRGIASEKCISCHKVADIGKKLGGNQNKPLFHLQLSNQKCNSCHTDHQGLNPEHSLSGFKHELLSTSIINNCSSCHLKPKDNFHSLIKDNCNKCHLTSNWIPSTFDHSAYFTLDQNHNTTCKTCHTNNNYNSFTCYGCHEHSESKIIAEHNEEGIYNISNCASCHKSGNEHDLKYNNKTLNESEKHRIKEFLNSKKH
jgi:hypothetical protein